METNNTNYNSEEEQKKNETKKPFTIVKVDKIPEKKPFIVELSERSQYFLKLADAMKPGTIVKITEYENNVKLARQYCTQFRDLAKKHNKNVTVVVRDSNIYVRKD